MKVSEAIEKLTVKRDDALHFQKLYRAGDVGWSANESKAIAFKIAINTLQQIDEPQAEKVEVPDWFDQWYKAVKNDSVYPKETALKLINQCGWGHMLEYQSGENVPDSNMTVWINENRLLANRAILDGYTVKLKRWVVRTSSAYFEQFSGDSNHPFNFDATHNICVALTFNDRAKAEAVATLVEGSVEEI